MPNICFRCSKYYSCSSQQLFKKFACQSLITLPSKQEGKIHDSKNRVSLWLHTERGSPAVRIMNYFMRLTG